MAEENFTIKKKVEISNEYYKDGKDALKEAKLCFKHGLYKGAINRAYYADYNIICSVLILEGISPKTHKGVSSEFYLMFVKNELIDSEIHTQFCELQNMRMLVDYDKPFTISKEKTQQYLEHANNIFNSVNNLRKEVINKIKQTNKINKNNLNL